MKKIKILFIIDHFWGFGGTERYLYQLVTRLNKEKFSYLICAMDAWKKTNNIDTSDGINIINIDIKKIYGFDAFRKFFKLMQLIKENEIDIVQTFFFMSDTYGVLASKLAGVPHILSSRRDMGDLKKKSHIFLSRRFNKLIDHFIMVADAVGKSFSAIEGIPPEKMKTIYNGVDLDNWKPKDKDEIEKIRAEFNISSDSFILAYIAHYRPGKGHNVFFEALKRMKPLIKNMKAILVGGTKKFPVSQHIIQFCKDNNLEDNVIFIDYTYFVSKYYAASDIYCLVSDNEGCSNAILEAMASGKPVIATAVGGNPELVRDGETGILIPPNDPDALVQAALKLYRNPELRKSMGYSARQRAEKYFSLEKMIKQVENFYIQLNENGMVR